MSLRGGPHNGPMKLSEGMVPIDVPPPPPAPASDYVWRAVDDATSRRSDWRELRCRCVIVPIEPPKNKAANRG